MILGHLFGLSWRRISELRRFDKMADVDVDAFWPFCYWVVTVIWPSWFCSSDAIFFWTLDIFFFEFRAMTARGRGRWGRGPELAQGDPTQHWAFPGQEHVGEVRFFLFFFSVLTLDIFFFEFQGRGHPPSIAAFPGQEHVAEGQNHEFVLNFLSFSFWSWSFSPKKKNQLWSCSSRGQERTEMMVIYAKS